MVRPQKWRNCSKLNNRHVREYTMWNLMIQRTKPKCWEANPSYFGATVVDEWFDYDVFHDWLFSQKGWGDESLGLLSVDKDFLFSGNKMYSPERCVLIPRVLNNFIIKPSKQVNGLIGAKYRVDCGKYQSMCSNPATGKQESLGYFLSEQDAHSAYLVRKKEHAVAYVEIYSGRLDNRVIDALLKMSFGY